jgi:short-subunit dehydrogenase
VHGCYFFLPAMIERGAGGHVINLASLTAFRPNPTQIAYSAVKAAVLGFSEALRLQLLPTRIGVSAICPGVVNTPLPGHARWRGRAAAPEFQARVIGRYQRQGCSPDLVADAIFRSVQRNRAVVPVTRAAWTAYWAKRISPGLADWMALHHGSLR